MDYDFKTKRLHLRKLEMTDQKIVQPLLTQENVMMWFGGALTSEQVSDWLVENRRRYEEDGYSYLVVEEKESKQIIGLMGLLKEEIEKTAYLGIAYMIKPEQQGKGYGKEGLAVLLEYAFIQLKTERVIAQISRENQPSQGFIQSLGFVRECDYERHQGVKTTIYEVYQLKHEQWEKNK